MQRHAVDRASSEPALDFGPSHWVYEVHFPGDPIFPGTLMVEDVLTVLD